MTEHDPQQPHPNPEQRSDSPDQPQGGPEPPHGRPADEPATAAGAHPGGEPPVVTPQSKDSTNLALLAHLLGIVTSVLGPLVIWLIKKDEDAYVDDQAKEALNFQIMFLIAYVVLGVASCITLGLAGLLYPIVWLVSVVFSILAAVESSKGAQYRYPFNLRLVS